MMRILWASNCPFSPSGYGVQTDLVTRRLLGDGHTLAIASNWGLQESTIQWPTEHGQIPVYASSGHRYSIDILPMHAQQFNAEIILTHYDSWVYDPALMAGRWVPWYPMDCEEYPDVIQDKVKHAMFRITQTRDSVEKAKRVGLDAEYVPAGFDGKKYYPRDRNAFRQQQGIPDDITIVGIVAANRGDHGSPSRKSYPQMFEAFAQFLQTHPNSLLYVHAHTQVSSGAHVDLEYLANKYGFADKMVKAHPYAMHSGMYTSDDMAMLYSGFDMLLNPSMGEGFGVPIVEAQACGTPVIVGDWTSMSEVAKSGAKVSKDDAYKYPIMGYGDMWLPRPDAIAEKMREAATWPRDEETRAKISERVQEYEIDRVYADNWRPVIKKLEVKAKALIAAQNGNREQRRASKKTEVLRDEAVAV